MKMMSDKTHLKQLMSYLLVGFISNATGYFVFLTMTFLGLNYKLAMTLLYCCCALISYVGNWHITFKRSGTFIKTFVRFTLIYVIGYFINLCLLLYAVDYLGYSYYLIEAIAILVVALFVFVAFKLFVFRAEAL